MRPQAALDSTDYVNPPYPRRRRLSTNRFCHLSCRPKWRHLWILRDLIRSLPVRSASGLPVYVAASRAAHSRLRFASLGMTSGVRNTDIRRGTRAAARTGPARYRFPDTRRFCLRNS